MSTITINVPDGYLFESTVNEVVYQWKPELMTNAALLYLVEYGAQRTVNDRCGGSDKTDDDKAKIATTTVTRLTSPDFTARLQRGSTIDPILKFMRQVWADILVANGKKPKAELFGKGGGLKADMSDWLDESIAKQSEAVRVKIGNAALKLYELWSAEQARRAEEKKRLAADITTTMDDDDVINI